MIESLFIFLNTLLQSKLSFLKICLRSYFFLPQHVDKKKSIYILGNGPSFKKQYPEIKDTLKNSCVMCVNAFPNTSLFEEIKPAYYIIASSDYFNDKAIDYNVNVRKAIIDALIEKCDWPIIFLLPASAKKNDAFLKRIKSNKHITISFFNNTPVSGFTKINHFYFNIGWGSPRQHNVLIPSILTSINIGFKEIKILGADHSWLPQITVNDKNEVMINQKHFYDESEARPKQMHKNSGRGNRKLHEVLQKFYYSFASYHELESYAKSKDSKIVNLTPDSYIDAFTKRHFY